MSGEKCSCRIVRSWEGLTALQQIESHRIERCAFCLGLEKRVAELEAALRENAHVFNLAKDESDQRIALLEAHITELTQKQGENK